MQRQYIKHLSKDSFFVNYNEKSYAKRIKQKCKHRSERTPQVMEESPYKIHISLQNEEYVKHLDKIFYILLKHFDQDAFYSFKHIDNERLKNTIASAYQIDEALTAYNTRLEDKEESNPDWESDFLKTINHYFNTNYDLIPGEEILDDMRLEIIATINDAERFVHSDQFTIYIPENFDQDKILNFCLEVNRYLKNENAIPGTICDVASPLGAYLNFRQEFLLEDIQRMNDNHKLDADLKIYAIDLYNDDHEQERRQRVVREQEGSFYQFLHSHLTQESQLQEVSLFQPADKNEEKQVSRKLEFPGL